ncbi:ABC transporter substrate-binding protein [Naumannella sp. ID2617S]|nr:ABC transporter substrate-binding protein [Naumannella sp. ID2617S]
MSHRTPGRVTVVLLTLLALLVTGCSGQSQGGQGAGGKTLIVGATAQPPTMDPTANDAAAIPQVLLYNVYETLVKVDSEGKLKPLLAQKWDVSPDNLTYTFNLDPGAKFASGRPVAAKDVVWSINRIKTGNATATLKKQLSVVEQATAADEHTLKVKLTQPSNLWLWDMSSTAGMVYDSEANADLASKTAGSGPFQLKEWLQGVSVTLGKNTDYWGTPARFDEVTIRYFSDPNAMNAAMLSGELDIISNLQAPAALPQFNDPSRFTVIEGTTNGEVVLSMNNTSPGLNNPKVRQAIRHAIDRRGLRDTVWAGKGVLIGAMVPPTDPWYEDRTGDFAYDPAKAKALLAEAGVQNLKLRLRLPTLPYATTAGQFVASQLKEVGIEATIDQLEFPARWVDTVLTKGDYDMSIVSHVEARDIVRFANPQYYFHYNNPEFQRLVTEADMGPAAEQAPKLKEAAKLMSTDAAADWLFLLPNLVITKPTITGVAKNATTLSFDLTTIASR